HNKDAEQGVSFCLVVHIGYDIEFRSQLRRCSVAWLSQFGLDCGIRYCFPLRHLWNFLATATAQLKYAMIPLAADYCCNQAITLTTRSMSEMAMLRQLTNTNSNYWWLAPSRKV